MLERDPQRRINAESALNHPFFASEMDIEVPIKEAKMILHENKSAFIKRQDSEAGSQLGKMSDRTMLYDFGKREVRPYFYS